MTGPIVVSRADWLAERLRLLEEEKAFTRQRDALSARRRALPWVRVEKAYVFETPAGALSLSEIFTGRDQLIVYHFMFGPDWELPCKSCSFWADNFNLIPDHLAQRDTAFVAISRAPLARLDAFKTRMGWSFPWYSSGDGDFNHDFGVSFRRAEVEAGTATYNYRPTTTRMSDLVGISVFARDAAGGVFHTYSTYGRGVDMLNGAYHYLDLTPKGRDEAGLEFSQSWVRHRDRYDADVEPGRA